MKSLAKKITPPIYLLQVFGAFFLLFYALGLPVLNTDTAWHLAAGDYMRATLSFPRTNMWSFSAPNETWYNLAWLWDIVTSFLLDKTGVRGVFTFLCAWYGLIGSVVALHLKQRNTKPSALYATLVLVLLLLLSVQWSRSLSFSILMVAIFHYVLHLSRTGSTKPTIIVLPLLMVLWANMHGGFVSAFFIFGIYGLEATFSRNYVWLKTLLTGAALCLLATFINPFGWQIWLCLYEQSTSSIMPYIMEWEPYQFSSQQPIDIFIVLLLIVTDFRNRTPPLADKILCIFWLVMACLSQRNFTLVAILSAPMMATGLGHWVKKDIAVKKLETTRSPKAALLVLLSVIFLGIIPFHQWIKRDLLLGENTTIPVQTLAFLREHYPHKKFMNEYNLGGYIIYFNKGLNPVFVDGRARTAYPEDIMEQIPKIWRAEYKTYLELIAQYHPDGVVLSNNSVFITQHPIPANWKPVYKDDDYSVYMLEKK